MTCKSHLFGIITIILLWSKPILSQSTDWKIKSNSADIDYQKNQISYLADAVFSDQNLSIHGDEILSQASSKKQDEYVEVKGRPAYLVQKDDKKLGTVEVWANSVKYQTKSKIITALEQVRFKQKSISQGEFTISGNKFVITQAKQYELFATGTPLTVSIKKTGEAAINAKANELRYQQQTQELELIGAVTLIRQRSNMTAEKIFYNIHTGTLRIPKSSKRQLNLVQKKHLRTQKNE